MGNTGNERQACTLYRWNTKIAYIVANNLYILIIYTVILIHLHLKSNIYITCILIQDCLYKTDYDTLNSLLFNLKTKSYEKTH